MSTSWSSFKLRINIQVPLDIVYTAFASAVGLESWFLRKAVILSREGQASKIINSDIQEGDSYEWYWHGYPDSVTEKGMILAANGSDYFGFTFTMNCPVYIHLYRECDETIVELTEGDIPGDEENALKRYIGDSKGWIFYLTNLKSVLEGGLDLRNRKTELHNVLTS